MKKFFISALSILACTGMIHAQNDCSYLFPQTKGTSMTTKCYDANGNLLGTTNYMVSDENQNNLSSSSEIVYSMTDTQGNVVNTGTIENTCNAGNVYIKTESKSDMGEATRMLSANINLMGSYLDYPDTYNPMDPFNGAFDRTEADLTLKVKDSNVKPVKVRIYDRNFEKNEPINVPAGTFDASKISYMVEVNNENDNTTKKFKNVEWYSLGKGIVRAESYDDKGNLVDYTVMTAMNEK